MLPRSPWLRRLLPALGCAILWSPTVCPAADAPAQSRIEARSASYLVVGIVHGDSMNIHLSRVLDNAPVRDAVVDVAFRGASHPALAQVDGSYAIEAKELTVPGPVAVDFRVRAGGAEEKLSGTLDVGGGGAADERGTWRNLAWWVLNFGVCIGFLLLWSNRRKRAAAAEAAEAAEAADSNDDQ